MEDLISKGALFNALANAWGKGEIFAIIQDMPTINTILGIPIQEALKIIAIYEETGEVPSRGFKEGFEAGYVAAHEEFLKALQAAAGITEARHD